MRPDVYARQISRLWSLLQDGWLVDETMAVSRSLTFGMLQAGNWPAAAPAEAVVKGVFGFLPPFRRADIQEKLVQAVRPSRTKVAQA